MFVPDFLTFEQIEDQVNSCQDLLTMFDRDPNFEHKNITGDQTWSFSKTKKTVLS